MRLVEPLKTSSFRTFNTSFNTGYRNCDVLDVTLERYFWQFYFSWGVSRLRSSLAKLASSTRRLLRSRVGIRSYAKILICLLRGGRCGNGLLTHILTAEGYSGHGIDVRARASWSNYSLASQSNLHVHALDPTVSPSTIESDLFLKKGVFIIGNHADELTPWVPVLSTLYAASGYLSIPCCAWSFDSRYERTTTPGFEIPSDEFVDNLNLGGDGTNTSSYSMYRIWLASLSAHCGWEVETDTLRIPSTRNWAIIGTSSHYIDSRMVFT